MKFGGTSLADAESILCCAASVTRQAARQPIVVVSALGGITDLLIQAVDTSLANDLSALDPLLGEIERRHRWAVAGCVNVPGDRHDLNLEMDAAFEDLRRRLRSVRILGEGTPKALDAIFGFGERLSAKIVAACFREAGIPAHWLDATSILRTDSAFGCAIPNIEITREAANAQIRPLAERGEIAVLGGYIGSDDHGDWTTLGRGGSDTTAAILGMVLAVEEIQIWTDVDGLMTADPRWVPDARLLRHVTFGEAAAMAFYGAKVLHPASIAPAVEQAIPVRVLNSKRTEAQGTLILGDETEAREGIASIASLRGLTRLRIRARRPQSDLRLTEAVIKVASAIHREPLLLHFERGAAMIIVRGPGNPEAYAAALNGQGLSVEVEMTEEQALICLVGAGLRSPGAHREALAALQGCSPSAISMGASPDSVLVVVDDADLRDSVCSLHARFLGAQKRPT